MREYIATLGRPGCGTCQSWAKPGFIDSSASTATWPWYFFLVMSQMVTRANSLLPVTQMPVGTFPGGNWKVGSEPTAVQVPAVATRPLGKTMMLQFDHWMMPRAIPSGAPPPLAWAHLALCGSG